MSSPALLVAPSPNVVAFLTLIAISEGTQPHAQSSAQNLGYDVIVSGVITGPERFTDFSRHPFAEGRPPKLIRRGPPPLYSTAAGRYQFLLSTWLGYQHRLRLPDFSPSSQDKAAMQQIADVGGIAPLMDGDIPAAIARCSGIWASLPGNHYHQGAHPVSWLMEQWNAMQQRRI